MKPPGTSSRIAAKAGAARASTTATTAAVGEAELSQPWPAAVSQTCSERYLALKLAELQQLEALLAQAQVMMQAERDAVHGYIEAPAQASQYTGTAWDQVARHCEQQMQQIRQGTPGLAQHMEAHAMQGTTARVIAHRWHDMADRRWCAAQAQRREAVHDSWRPLQAVRLTQEERIQCLQQEQLQRTLQHKAQAEQHRMVKLKQQYRGIKSRSL